MSYCKKILSYPLDPLHEESAKSIQSYFATSLQGLRLDIKKLKAKFNISAKLSAILTQQGLYIVPKQANSRIF
jgi:hypothetical protein